MYFKGKNDRPRPSQLCPALMPPLAVPGHASFPSGHSTQAHLMALCMTDVFGTLPMAGPMNDDLWTLADRIARNREIAGLHYPSDTKAGVDLATAVHALLQPATQTRYQASVAAGVGYKVFDTKSTMLDVQVGVGYKELRPEELTKAADGAVIGRQFEEICRQA